MAKLPIILYPDPILRQTASPVERVDDALKTLAENMLETMYAAPGVGLAAPQVGLSLRLFVMDPAKKEDERNPCVLINPEILQRGEGKRVYEEGCLSMPEIFADIERPASVLLRYVGADGELREEWFEGHAATVAQHEIDHLEGVMFIDHVSRLKRDMLIRKFRKIRRDEPAL